MMTRSTRPALLEMTLRPLVFAVALVAPSALAQNGAEGTTGEPAAANSGDAGAQAENAAPSKPLDLLSIARREADREGAALRARVGALLAELKSSTDDSLALIQGKIQQLAQIGMPALEQLLAAMNHEQFSPGAVNAGINASRAVALISDQQVVGALMRLAREGSKFGQRNAARALGLRGDPSVLPVLNGLLEAADKGVVRGAFRPRGVGGAARAADVLHAFVNHEDEETAATAIAALAGVKSDVSPDAVLARLKSEFGEPTGSEPVTVAALEFLAAHPTPDGLTVVTDILAANTSTVRVRQAAIAALQSLGLSRPSARKPVLSALEAATNVGLRTVVRAAALAMLVLGDDSGVDAVTADYDLEIQRNSKNYNARYKRADVYLEFKRWKAAYRDLLDGLKVEKEPRDPDRVYLALARAAAGQGRSSDAAKYLRKLPTQDFSGFPARFPEFQEMAGDSRYAEIFAAGP